MAVVRKRGPAWKDQYRAEPLTTDLPLEGVGSWGFFSTFCLSFLFRLAPEPARNSYSLKSYARAIKTLQKPPESVRNRRFELIIIIRRSWTRVPAARNT